MGAGPGKYQGKSRKISGQGRYDGKTQKNGIYVKDKPNIILIILDTTRADAIYPLESNVRMPFLKEFSKECNIFENAVSPASWTIPAHASILTGLYPSRNGVIERVSGEIPNYSELYEKFSGETLPETLSKLGYHTIGYSQNLLIAPDTSFSRGFEEFYYTHNHSQDIYFRMLENYNTLIREYGASLGEIVKNNFSFRRFKKFYSLYTSIKKDTNWLNNNDLCDKGGNLVVNRINKSNLKEPFFLFINLMEMHDPHDSTSLKFGWSDSFFRKRKLEKSIVQNVRNSYFNCATLVDHILSEFMISLKQRNLLENSALIITSDHGQSLMEKDGFFGHGTFLYDEIIKVPLIIRLPGGKKIHIKEGYQSTSRIKNYIQNIIENNIDYDSFTEDFVFSEVFGSLDNEMRSHEKDPRFKQILGTVDIPRKCIYNNGYKLTINFNNKKIIEFTRNGENCNLETNKIVLNDLLEKLDVFG